jgi:hypothetical protein
MSTKKRAKGQIENELPLVHRHWGFKLIVKPDIATGSLDIHLAGGIGEE